MYNVHCSFHETQIRILLMDVARGQRVGCKHDGPDGEHELKGFVERVNTITIRVLFDGEAKSRLIKKKSGFYTVLPGQEGPVERNEEEFGA